MPEGEEGRGTPRNASGSRVAGCDPRITEWGNPSADRPRRPAQRSRTGQNAGTETSQYRDRKSKRELLSSGERTGASLNGWTRERLEARSIRVAGEVGGVLQTIPQDVAAAV